MTPREKLAWQQTCWAQNYLTNTQEDNNILIYVYEMWLHFSGAPDLDPDPNSLDPVNRIHYHVVVPITVSMYCVLSPNVKQKTSDKLQ